MNTRGSLAPDIFLNDAWASSPFASSCRTSPEQDPLNDTCSARFVTSLFVRSSVYGRARALRD